MYFIQNLVLSFGFVLIQIHKSFFNKYSSKPLKILNFVQIVIAASQNSVEELNGSCASLTVSQEEITVHYSGNPGYVIGLPLASGTRTVEYPSLH